jgi:hypothetical protein
MPLGFLKNHLRDIEERICAASHFDLASQGIHAFVVRYKCDIDLREGNGWG